jgi:spoIIIJ-associated protein
MKILEIEGKNIDEAIQNACKEFNATREKLNIEIISEGSAGFLGFGTKKAKIKASLMHIDISLSDPFSEPRKPEPPPQAREPREPREPRKPPARPAAEPPAPPRPSPQPETVVTAPRESHNAIVPAGEGVAVQAKALLEGILTRMDLDYPVTVEETEDSISLRIQGDGGGLLIGRRGQNLDAIQYIINKAVNKSAGERKIISVDIEEYRQKREVSLVALAEKLGDKVKKSKKSVTVDHMNAHDRRIIHMALQNDEALVTKSRGEGEYKKIIIMPAKKR